MTPQIALDLSLDGITVLSRAPGGGWWREGTVRLDMPDMPERLARLRDTVETRVGADFTSILILPDSQLLYTSLERDDRKADETIRALLKGRTPYPVEDLTFDHIERGDRLQVAVVALETLLEAETFAAEYGFRPVAVVANPQNPAYPGIPNFGKTGLADDLLRGTPLSLDLSDGFSAVTAPPLPAPAADPAPEFTSPRRASEEVADAPIADLPGEDAPSVPPEPDASDTETPPVETPVGPTDEPPAPKAPPAVRFTSSRAAAPKTDAPEARAVSGERLAKVAPRLTPTPQIPKRAATAPVIPAPTAAAQPPAPSADGPLAAPSNPKRPARAGKLKAPASKAPPQKAPHAATAKTIPAAIAKAGALAPSGDAPAAGSKPALPEPGPVPAGALGTIAMRLKARNAAAKDAKVTDQAAAERLVEAQSLALPGLARERAAIAPKSTARLGLYLTVGLLAVLIAIGAGSVLLGPEETFDETPDDITTSQLSLAPNPTAAPVPAETDFAAAETPVILPPLSALPLDGDTGDTPDQQAIDMAALLPLSESAPVRINPSQIPDLITLPTLGQADEAPIAGPLSIDQVLPEVAPGLAAAPALDTVPVAETEPAIFTESFAAAGESFLPRPFSPPTATGSIEGLITASVDRAIILGDAAGPPAAPSRPSLPLTQIDPPPAEQASDADAALGLVTATVEGTVAPGGYTVILGRPVLLPLPRPTSADADADAAPETNAADVAEAPVPTAPDLEEIAERTAAEIEAEAVLRRTRPIQRPEDRAAEVEVEETEPEIAEEPIEDPALIALSRLRPTVRPASVVRTAAVATAAAEAAVAAATSEQENAAVLAAQQAASASLASTQEDTQSGPVSELALAASGRPRTRPRSVERDAARIVTQRREQASSAVASAPAQPSTPAARTVDSGAQTTRSAGGSVARAATETNVLRLNQVNLIGVYGKAGARRALVRLANGRYVKVEVGDRLDRGRVTAIGESELSYQRGGRNQVLRMPRA